LENKQPRLGTRLAARLVAVAVIAIVLGAVVFGVYLPRASTTSAKPSSSASVTSTTASPSTGPTSSTSTGEHSSTTSPAPCALSYRVPANNQTTFSNGTQVTESAEPALVMRAGSTMELCMEYTNYDANQSFSGPAPIYAFQWPACYDSCVGPPANNVSASASPENISLSAGQSNVVDYTIAAGKNSTGFVGLSLGLFTAFKCSSIPLAVGYSPSQVNDSDFPLYYAGLPNCPTPAARAQIVGYTGASIAYLRSESRFNPTENVTDITVSSFPTSSGGENITFSVHVQTFSHPVTIEQGNASGQEAVVGGYIRVFTGNPELTTLPADDYCSWYPNNSTAVNDMTLTPVEKLPSGYLQVDAPVLQLSPYSSANYSFSILIVGPIASYTAIDVSSAVVILAYFPVSIAGQLQTISGSCAPIFF
jgi:hypothetical protein